MDPPDLRFLSAFAAIYELRNLTRATARLRRTPAHRHLSAATPGGGVRRSAVRARPDRDGADAGRRRTPGGPRALRFGPPPAPARRTRHATAARRVGLGGRSLHRRACPPAPAVRRPASGAPVSGDG